MKKTFMIIVLVLFAGTMLSACPYHHRPHRGAVPVPVPVPVPRRHFDSALQQQQVSQLMNMQYIAER
ncbi:MAG: hypothetical protein BMS9Abin36_1887 [Gammaproteobacteria bacterium]|nr:MAG: hypothetical protein BMS9Abin36_1887 [Gammaproteobacteria bacterium]